MGFCSLWRSKPHTIMLGEHVWSPPLTSHEVIIETIAATTTRTGLKVQARLDTGTYKKGIRFSDKEMKALERRSTRRDQFHGDWNYTLLPAPQQTHPTPRK